MSKINTYTTVTPVAGDKVIGTDVGGTPADATKNFTVESIAALANANFVSVLSAESTATQTVSVLTQLDQVEFGVAQGTASDPVMIDVNGTVTFNQIGAYTLEICLNADSSAATPAMIFWAIQDAPAGGAYVKGETNLVYVAIQNQPQCSFRSAIRNITAVGDTMQVMFTSETVAGLGELEGATVTNLNDVPSASLNIYRLEH